MAVGEAMDKCHRKLLDCPCPGYDEEFKKREAGNELKAIADSSVKNGAWVEPV